MGRNALPVLLVSECGVIIKRYTSRKQVVETTNTTMGTLGRMLNKVKRAPDTMLFIYEYKYYDGKSLNELLSSKRVKYKTGVIQYNVLGVEVNRYQTITRAAISVGCSHSRLNNHLLGIYNSCNGYIFMYYNDKLNSETLDEKITRVKKTKFYQCCLKKTNTHNIEA